MPIRSSTIIEEVARQANLSVDAVRETLRLLDEGNTVAFLARYRRDKTGGLGEEQVAIIQREAGLARHLAERKKAILKSIEGQGPLTADLQMQIEAATTLRRLEDLYLPFKAKKQTLATVARQRGLAPLAEEVLAGAISAEDFDSRAASCISVEDELPTEAEVKAGVGHLIAEQFSERADVREGARKILAETADLVVTKVDAAETPLKSTSEQVGGDQSGPSEEFLSVRQRRRQKLERALQDYFGFRERVDHVRPHRVLAINRGERGKVLRVKLEGDHDALLANAASVLVTQDHPLGDFLRQQVADAMQRLVLPSLDREIRREMSERAESHAVHVFARNLRKLLLQPPVHGRRVLAIDPGFKSGCKLAAIDEFGSVLDHGVVHLVGGDENVQSARERVVQLINEHNLSAVAIGNGIACRETEEVVADAIANELHERGIEYVIVNGAGASVYSTSAVGREELPDHDAIYRSAISIGRRLLDPLSELVKINPANIGVGMYQHDVKAKHLRESLDAVVESCVNYVGVDLNAASPALLSYVSGLNQLTARRIYEHRQEHGPFRSREQLKEVSGVGEATFVQAAGFLRIADGDEPLDATWIHPESYAVARKLLEHTGCTLVAFPDVEGIDIADLAEAMEVGEMLLQDIATALRRVGRDAREGLPAPIFRSGIMKLDDIQPGMELSGTVLNVVDFGAFVDIGLSDSALVHISHLANRYIRDPHDVVSIGDVIRVWVLEVDKDRRRVALTGIPPEARVRRDSNQPEKPRQSKRPKTKPAAAQKTNPGPRPPKFRQRPAKPAKPITPQMVEGDEPMRSFSDLLQYYEVKQQDDSDQTE